MERGQIKFRPEFLVRHIAQFADFQLAQFVRERLTGPADIPVYLRLDIRGGQSAVVGHEGDGLLLAPTLGMNAGVDHQAARPPHFVGQPPHILGRRII